MSSKKRSSKTKKGSKPHPAQKSIMGFMEENSTDMAEKVVKKKQEKTSPLPKKKDVEVTEKKTPARNEVEDKKIDLSKQQKIVEVEQKIEISPPKEKVPNIPTGKKLEKSDLIFYKEYTEPFGEQVLKKKLDFEDSKGAVKSVYVKLLEENNMLCDNMDEGILLTVEYSGKHNKAYAKFYDLKEKKIKFWLDNTGHQPYALHKRSKEEIQNVEVSALDLDLSKEEIEEGKSSQKLVDFSGFDRVETIELEDIMYDRKIKMSKIYATSPNDIGKKGAIDKENPENIRNTSIYNFLAKYKLEGHWEEDIVAGPWEANIRYHHNFIYDRNLIPGLIYEIKNGKLSPIELEGSEELEKQLLDLFSDEPAEFQEMAQRYMKLFSYPIPDMRRVAFDIEVDVPEDKSLPDPARAEQQVTSISFSGSDGVNKVYVLWRDNVPIGENNYPLPDNTEIIFFENEKDLLIETFRIIWDYPLVVSFNGDNFDFNYLYHRAKFLKVPNEINPIELKNRGGFSAVNTNAFLKQGIHLDLYQVFSNRSLKGYAFGNAYERSSLDEISKAFLDSEKIKHQSGEKFSAEDIANLDLFTLLYYNMVDSVLTLELTKFGDNSVMNLLVYLMRMTKLPLQDLFRHQISMWVRNMLYYEHRYKKYLIPRQSEIENLKPGRYERNIGGYVIDPIPGIHFNVMVMDFSSLYPTIIKKKNLSYETVKCFHQECTNNFLPDLPYHVCTKRMGIFAILVGFFRDVRVKWYKPRSSDKKIPKEERGFAKILSAAIKVFVNSSYGVAGSEAFPLKCSPVAEATTAIGRYSISQTIEKARSLKISVLYGDTDSVFLLNPSKEQTEILEKWSIDELDLDLEAEKTYQFLSAV